MSRYTRYILLCLFTLLPIMTMAVKYNVRDLVSPHSIDKNNYICDPDQYLQSGEYRELNAVAQKLDKEVEVEMAIVIVREYNDTQYTVEDFALTLFNTWGLGKEGKNTGVMIFLAINSREVRIQTGGGVEGLLPDGVCGEIIDKMKGVFQSNRFGYGLYYGARKISERLTTPEAKYELLLAYNPKAVLKEIKIGNIIYGYFIFCFIVFIALWVYAYYQFNGHYHQPNNVRYQKIKDRRLYIIVASVFCPIPVAILAYYWKKHLVTVRMKPVTCPHCKKRMVLLSEQEEDVYLSHAEQTEEMVKTVDYDVWLCQSCKETIIMPYHLENSKYKQCKMCGAKTETLIKDVIIQRPTSSRDGLGERHYVCKNCGFKHTEQYKIPKQNNGAALAAGAAIGMAAMGGNRGGGGFSGGSFGGGRSFGGGATGKW